MVFRGGTERVSVVADKGGGGERGSIENWLPMRGRGGKESKEWHSLRWDQLNFIVTQ